MSTLSGIITMIVVSASNRLLKSSYLKVVSPRRVDELHEVLGGASIGVTEGASHAAIFVFSRTARELFLLVYFFLYLNHNFSSPATIFMKIKFWEQNGIYKNPQIPRLKFFIIPWLISCIFFIWLLVKRRVFSLQTARCTPSGVKFRKFLSQFP